MRGSVGLYREVYSREQKGRVVCWVEEDQELCINSTSSAEQGRGCQSLVAASCSAPTRERAEAVQSGETHCRGNAIL